MRSSSLALGAAYLAAEGVPLPELESQLLLAEKSHAQIDLRRVAAAFLASDLASVIDQD